jgi:glycosyltransferase involved in cell wall biosynthesis
MNYRSGEAPDHLRRSALARWTLKWVEKNAVPSAFLNGVFDSFGIPAEVIPNIVDMERFAFRRRDPLGARILSTRNFEDHYNIACTLRAFHIVQMHRPEASLTLVGAGSQDAELRLLAEQLGLRHVTFAGRVAPEDMWRYYADADIYLQTPDLDNMPSSILEAFASGCAVVSTEAGGVPAILTNGRHGLLVPCGDHSRAATAILRLLDDPALARDVTEQAVESCTKYQWTTVRGQWLALYQDLSRARGLPAPSTA